VGLVEHFEEQRFVLGGESCRDLCPDCFKTRQHSFELLGIVEPATTALFIGNDERPLSWSALFVGNDECLFKLVSVGSQPLLCALN
jgi:hypothetical protein